MCELIILSRCYWGDGSRVAPCQNGRHHNGLFHVAGFCAQRVEFLRCHLRAGGAPHAPCHGGLRPPMQFRPPDGESARSSIVDPQSSEISNVTLKPRAAATPTGAAMPSINFLEVLQKSPAIGPEEIRRLLLAASGPGATEFRR